MVIRNSITSNYNFCFFAAIELQSRIKSSLIFARLFVQGIVYLLGRNCQMKENAIKIKNLNITSKSLLYLNKIALLLVVYYVRLVSGDFALPIVSCYLNKYFCSKFKSNKCGFCHGFLFFLHTRCTMK